MRSGAQFNGTTISRSRWLVERTIVPATFLDIETFGGRRGTWRFRTSEISFKWLTAIRWLKLMSFLPCNATLSFIEALRTHSIIHGQLRRNCVVIHRDDIYFPLQIFSCVTTRYSCSQI